jgi:hypothetical protein
LAFRIDGKLAGPKHGHIEKGGVGNPPAPTG